jgi:beta-lactamase regulating signal transducer with metallopeptidase domain
MSQFPKSFYPGDAMAAALAGVLLQITVVIVLAVLVCRAFVRRGAATRHAVWLAALGCVFASPLLIFLTDRAGLTLIAIPLSTPPAAENSTTDGPWVEATNFPSLAPGAAPLPSPARETKAIESNASAKQPTIVVANPPTLNDSGNRTGDGLIESMPPVAGHVDVVRAIVGGLFAIWAAGTLLLMLRFLHGCYVLASLRRNIPAMDARCFGNLLEQVRTALGTETLPIIEISADVTGPVAGGVFRPRVLLPEGLVGSLDSCRLRDVLIHECAHVLRRDPLIGLLQRLAEMLFWPHPLVHYLNRRLAQAREEICDNYVLQHGDACTYARTLLTLAERGGARRPLALAGLIDPYWRLADRVAGLLDSRRALMTRISPWTFAGILVVMLTAGVAVPAVRLGGEPANDDPKSKEADKEEAKPDVSKARIEGVVVDEVGKPVAGAVVSPLRLHARSAEVAVHSATDGSFRLPLDGASARYQTIRAMADEGKRQGIFEFHDTVLGSVATARIVLKPSVTINVRVTDGKKAPVAKATVGVVALYSVMASAETDSRGLASLRLPADAKVNQVVALKSGVGFDYFENYSSWPGSVVGKLPAQVALTLDGAQSITVKATDSRGFAMEGVDFVPWTVQKKGRLAYVNIGGALKSMMAQTDGNGIAVFDYMPHDLNQSVTALQLNDAYSLPDAPYFDPAKPATSLVAKLFKNVPISGKVTLPNSKPAAGILLQVEGRGNTNHYFRNVVRTKADGTYSLLVYPNQSYLIAVTDDQWAAPSIQGGVVREDEPRDDLNFRLNKGTLIQGKVTLGRGKKPAANQTITLLEQGAAIARDVGGNWAQREELVRWATTDKDGRYSIRAGPGEYKFYHLGDKQENLTVKDEQTIERNFHADRLPRGLLKGEVLARAVDGKPVPGAIVKSDSIDGYGHVGFEVVTDEKGHFETERWRDKEYVYARSPEGTLATIVTIGEDDEETKILLGEAAILKGRLVDKAGKPVASMRIGYNLVIGPKEKPLAVARLYTEADKEGRFTLPGLVLGARCTVSALADKGVQQLKEMMIDRAETQDLGDLLYDPPEQ